MKLAYTLFVAVLVPNYWRAYSPWTFLYFCDVALLLTLPALWLESPLLISLPAVGLALPQLLWVVDFLTGPAVTGMTSYMFDPNITRCLCAGCRHFTAGCRFSWSGESGG